MSEPKNHHWLPQFLSRQWCGDDGLVNRFFRPHTKVVASRKSTKSLGPEEHLYTTEWKRLNDKYYLEKEVFTKAVDTPASAVLTKMLEDGTNGLTHIEKKTFAGFLVVLISRVRERFADENPKDFLSFDWFMSAARSDDSTLKHAADAEIRKFYDDNFRGAGKHIVVNAMLELSTEPGFTDAICGLEWRIISNNGCGQEYVLGDRPILGLMRDGRFERISLPLSPTHLLLAAKGEHFDSDVMLRDEFREIFVVEENVKQFQKADDFVISRGTGKNNGLLNLAEMHMKRRNDHAETKGT